MAFGIWLFWPWLICGGVGSCDSAFDVLFPFWGLKVEVSNAELVEEESRGCFFSVYSRFVLKNWVARVSVDRVPASSDGFSFLTLELVDVRLMILILMRLQTQGGRTLYQIPEESSDTQAFLQNIEDEKRPFYQSLLIYV